MSTVSQIFTEARRIIHDESQPYRWSDVELLAYINAGNRQTVALIPDANTVETVTDLLTSRVARQSLPEGGIKFIRVARNYADDGTTPQGTLRYVEKDALDTFEPTWEYVSAKADGANYFEHYCHDPSEPAVYYLYPAPAADNKFIALVYSAIPAIMISSLTTLPLPDQYFNAIVQYTVYRALTKEARETIPSAFRQELWQNYLQTLGLQSQAETQVSAENNRAPEGS
jgi:hypothetical protein